MGGQEVKTAVLGFPRIGRDRELKAALESFWRGETPADDLDRVALTLRRRQLTDAAAAEVDVLPSNDFSLYDHVLDTALMGPFPAGSPRLTSNRRRSCSPWPAARTAPPPWR